jgi:hypothetical protein
MIILFNSLLGYIKIINVIQTAIETMGNIAIQSAQACPSSGAVAPNGNPDASNTRILSQDHR